MGTKQHPVVMFWSISIAMTLFAASLYSRDLNTAGEKLFLTEDGRAWMETESDIS